MSHAQSIRIGLLSMMGLLLSGLGGCETAGFIADVVAGGQPVPAIHELADRPTLVLVETANDIELANDIPGLIAGRIGQQLTSEEVLTKVISFNDFVRFRAETPDFYSNPTKWNVARIGRELGAEQVIYVSLQTFRVSEDNVIYRPLAEARVKVIDATAGTRVFPPATDRYGKSGHPIVQQQNYGSRDGANSTTDLVVARRLAEALAQDVAWLFYEHKLPEPGSRLPG
jgi:hypothetical protein